MGRPAVTAAIGAICKCGQPLLAHIRCRECDILLGASHWYQPHESGLCGSCRDWHTRNPSGVADTLEELDAMEEAS